MSLNARPPRERLPRLGPFEPPDLAPNLDRDQVAVRLVAPPFERARDRSQRLPLAVNAYVASEGSDRACVRDVELPRRAPPASVLHLAPLQRSDDAEAEQKVLHLPREPLARRCEAELSLPGRQNSRPAVGREQPVQEQRDEAAPELEDRRRDELVTAV